MTLLGHNMIIFLLVVVVVDRSALKFVTCIRWALLWGRLQNMVTIVSVCVLIAAALLLVNVVLFFLCRFDIIKQVDG